MNLGCVQRQEGSTGESFKTALDHTFEHRPAAGAFENHVRLNRVWPATGISDAEYVESELQKNGFSVLRTALQATKAGSKTRRERLWWLYLEGANRAEDLRIMHRMLEALKIEDEEPWEPYMLPPELRQCDRVCPREWQAFSSYKDDHIRFFDQQKLPWPAPRDTFGSELAHLDQRAFEVCVYADATIPWNSETPGARQFMDASFSITRLCGDNGIPWNPWSPDVPPLRTAGKYIMRTAERLPLSHGSTTKGVWRTHLRQLDGLELMQLLGFDLRYFADDNFPTHQLATSFAGNAFNAFQVAQVLTALAAVVSPEAYEVDG